MQIRNQSSAATSSALNDPCSQLLSLESLNFPQNPESAGSLNPEPLLWGQLGQSWNATLRLAASAGAIAVATAGAAARFTKVYGFSGLASL